MTDGQRLAVEQLKAIEQGARGSLELLDIGDGTSDWLHIDVSIACTIEERVPAGLPVRTRERFTLLISARFATSSIRRISSCSVGEESLPLRSSAS